MMQTIDTPTESPSPAEHLSTLEVARILGLAVRSVQLMVDRGELQAWKTAGGHRRIARESVAQWQESNHGQRTAPAAERAAKTSKIPRAVPAGAVKVLFIEDSVHYQNMVGLLLRQKFPQFELRTAGDGISGLIMVGQYEPDVLLVDLMLPGIDGAALVSSLRMHGQFRRPKIIVVTSLTPEQRAPFAFALQDVPVVFKPHLVTELPEAMSRCLAQTEKSV
jgi:excisionase family DNA binding protein